MKLQKIINKINIILIKRTNVSFKEKNHKPRKRTNIKITYRRDDQILDLRKIIIRINNISDMNINIFWNKPEKLIKLDYRTFCMNSTGILFDFKFHMFILREKMLCGT